MQLAFADCIASAEEELVTEMATTPERVLEAKRLRYRVYCEERGFEAGDNGLEEDVYDGNSRHVLIRSRATGVVFGTLRVVTTRTAGEFKGLPMERVCPEGLLASMPRPTTGEVSRFALLRDRSGISPAASALMRLCLIQGMLQICSEDGLTDICALMERTLLRLLRTSAMHFEVIGQPIEYRGVRYPSAWNVRDGLIRARNENPAVWSFITRNGALSPVSLSKPQPIRLAA